MVDMVLTSAKVICVAKAAIRFNERLWVSEFECANFWKHFAQHSTVYVEIRGQAMTIIEARKAALEGKTVIGPNGDEYHAKAFDPKVGIQCWSLKAIFGEWTIKTEPLKIYVNLYREGLSEVLYTCKEMAMKQAISQNYIRTITFVEEK